MNAAMVIALAQAAAQLVETLTPLVGEARAVLGSEDQAALDAALDRIAQANDAGHARLQSKLRS